MSSAKSAVTELITHHSSLITAFLPHPPQVMRSGLHAGVERHGVDTPVDLHHCELQLLRASITSLANRLEYISIDQTRLLQVFFDEVAVVDEEDRAADDDPPQAPGST